MAEWVTQRCAKPLILVQIQVGPPGQRLGSKQKAPSNPGRCWWPKFLATSYKVASWTTFALEFRPNAQRRVNGQQRPVPPHAGVLVAGADRYGIPAGQRAYRANRCIR